MSWASEKAKGVYARCEDLEQALRETIVESARRACACGDSSFCRSYGGEEECCEPSAAILAMLDD